MPSRERGHFYGLHASGFVVRLDIVGLSFERAEAGAQALT